MTGRYKAYSNYKKHDNETLQKLPSDWILKPLGLMAEQTKTAFVDGPFGSDLKSNEYQDNGVPLIQLNNIAVGEHKLKNMKFVTEQKKQQLSRHIAKPDDIVIAKMADPVARAAAVKADYNEYIIVADCVKLTVDTSVANRSFVIYAINSKEVNSSAVLVSTGTTRVRINLTELKKLRLPYPSMEEQQKIASFLDHETAKIDTLITKQEKLIELLKEKRQAVISHAVTKGLNPDAPMKDSGVEWLGEVPEHWVVCAIKRELSSLDYRRIPLSADERGKRSGSYRYYGASGVIDHIDDYIFDEPTVLVGEDGANLVNRSTPLAFAAYGQYWVNNHAHILSPKDGLAEYWAEVIEIIDVTPLVSGSAQPKLTAEALGNLKIAFPPFLEERETINSFIRSQKTTFDSLMGKAQLQVKLLKERKTALISAAVTGKIDVRDFVSEQGQPQGVQG